MNGNDNTYFSSYDDLEVHRLMLLDKPRTESYQKAILDNREFFKGKIVLDVGAGGVWGIVISSYCNVNTI